MAMPSAKPRLRKREIVLALAAGGLAAAAAAAILDESDSRSAPFVQVNVKEDFSNLAPFTAISSTGPQDVVITYGDTQSVRAEGSPEARALMGVVVEDGVLSIRPRNGGWQRFWGGLNSATYHVTLPRLNSVTLSGSGDIRVDKVEGDAFSSTIDGSGDFSIGSLKVDRAAFTISGTGSITAAGTARDTQVSVSGPGDVSARGLRTRTASILVNGPGDVRLTADEHVNGSVNGPGDVDVSGSAQCSISEEGPGDVDCEGGDN
jgi:hypothetical protein